MREVKNSAFGLGAPFLHATMACFSTRNAAFITEGRRSMSGAVPGTPLVVLSCDRRDSYGSLVFQAARLLGPPTRFEASKLKVVFMGEEIENQPLGTIPRAYTLTHCDFTANLTLAVSNSTYNDKMRGWQTTLQRDDVVAEWKNVNGEMSLHVHCYVSGANLFQQLAAEFRYHIFSKELPLVLKSVIHGDSVLFSEHPELLEAVVRVYFHSKSERFNRIECWGPLKDATKKTYEDRLDGFQNAAVERIRSWASPRTIFHALVAFLF